MRFLLNYPYVIADEIPRGELGDAFCNQGQALTFWPGSYSLAGYKVQRKRFLLQIGRTSQVFATEWVYMFLVNGSFRARQLGNALYKMVGP